jgi:hypothetical protein
MTLTLFPSSRSESTEKRYYISQFDDDTYQIIDSIEKREVFVCSNYDDWEDAEERAKRLMKLLNQSNENTLERVNSSWIISFNLPGRCISLLGYCYL